MATITFEYYGSTGPAWTDIGANTLVFSGTGGLATAITVGQFNDETHIGNGDPGTDQCGANHCNNNKYLTGTTIDINGGGSQALNDTNLTANECTLRLHFNHGSSVSATNARFYAFDPGAAVTDEALNCDVYAFEQGIAATTWTQINDDSGNTGGDNAGQRLDLANKGPGTDLYWYVAVSLSPEVVGNINAVDFGFALTYS